MRGAWWFRDRCHNPFEAERDLAKREAAIARVREELERIATALTCDRNERRGDDVHVNAECALRDHPTLGRWVRQLKSGRLRIDTAKILAEEQLDGKYLLSTSDPDLSAEDVALGYKNLLIRVAERRTGMTWRRFAIEMGRIHTVTLTGTAGTVTQTTPLTEIQQGIVDACGVTTPPRVTHPHPS